MVLSVLLSDSVAGLFLTFLGEDFRKFPKLGKIHQTSYELWSQAAALPINFNLLTVRCCEIGFIATTEKKKKKRYPNTALGYRETSLCVYVEGGGRDGECVTVLGCLTEPEMNLPTSCLKGPLEAESYLSPWRHAWSRLATEVFWWVLFFFFLFSILTLFLAQKRCLSS